MPNTKETNSSHNTIPPINDGKDNNSIQPLHSPHTTSEKEEHKHISSPKLGLITTAVTLVMFLTLLDTTIIVTVQSGVYQYTFLTFLFLFEVGSAVCGAALSSKMLIIGRAVAGLGGSGLRNGALGIITECVPLAKRPPYFGVMMGLSLCGAAVGPLLGGLFTKFVSWRWCFYVNLPIGALAAILLLAIRIPDVQAKKLTSVISALSTLDLVGFLLFAPCAIMFLMALEWGGSKYAWSSGTIISLFCGAGSIFLVFLGWEHHLGDEATIPFSMVRKRAVWSSYLVIWFFFGGMMVYSYYLPIYFQAVKGTSPLASGVDILPLILSQMVAVVLSGGLVKKMGYYLPFSIASSILMAISAGLITTLSVGTSTGRWIGYQIIGGFGQGLGMQMPYIAIQHSIPQQHNAVALALIVFMQNLGGAVFLALAQTIFTTDLRSGLARFAPTVDVGLVEAAGATGFRGLVDSVEVIGVLEAYDEAVTRNFFFAVVCAGVMLFCCWGMGWVRIEKGEESG
ncbi:hypothetical protein HYFRA_00006499 [Hymenoscyphus fraxineus]|uniref:Major facilitator superfamily (MFS) profile domain-containing protein n=1 Tax=Hymenoscyphus fraxineus TaxID=746836 RepID=A0A9N9KPR1_9HELO|nr:hypothetical protein HYFRA_00006499 [Hymenoscyphus fraxineus]